MSTKHVVMKCNFMDRETLQTYLRGQRAELPAADANRLIVADFAVSLEDDDLKSQSVEDLKEDAEVLGVDTSGGKKSSKADLAKAIQEG